MSTEKYPQSENRLNPPPSNWPCVCVCYLTGRTYAVTVVYKYSNNTADTADIDYVHSC